ncbi:phage minor capsid protein [uncultured Parolsenella sp.]|uniref:phage minor capsid protein n=1 Tax=uncultured Parolsenella sp. TaxID=2083008 RepID=UPI0027D9BAFB|nr:phage minor capsid protein [uncultured Parolsenella sp.]
MLTPDELAALGQGPGDAVQALADGALSMVMTRLVASVAGADLARAIADSGAIPAIVLSALGGSAEGLSARCAAEAERALERSRRVDLQVIRARNPEAFGKLNRTGDELLSLLGDFQRRCNLSMAADAQASYRAIVTDIVPRVAGKVISEEEGVAEAVRRMAERGIRTVDYASGRRERPDVVMRRHLQTLVRQAANDDTESFCRRAGIRLVEVDSHRGARESHRVWQGEVYGLDGPVEVDGVKYPGLHESGAWDGMREPNCLHSMGPFRPGQERRWSHTPDEDAGHDPAETYALLQRQRANERKIRDAKREAAELEAQGLDSAGARLRLGRAQQAQRTLMRENPGLQRRPDRERAFGADGRPVNVQPLNRSPKSVRAALDESRDRIRAKGASASRVEELLASTPGFKTMDRAGQEREVRYAIDRAAAERRRDERVRGPLPNSVNMGSLRKHIPGTDGYARKVESCRKKGYDAPSAFAIPEADVVELTERAVGKGEPMVNRAGNWNGSEIYDAGRAVGYIVAEDGSRLDTSMVKIHYSKTGTHPVPYLPKEGGQ